MKSTIYANVREIINNMPQDMPIYTDAVVAKITTAFNIEYSKAKRIVNVYLKRLADQQIITRVKRGMYGKPKDTAFGVVTVDKNKLIMHELLYDGDNTIGFFAGATLLNIIGLSTLLPKNQMIATNKYRTLIPNGVTIETMRPIAHINASNMQYLRFIEAVKAMRKYPIDANNPQSILHDMIIKGNFENDLLVRYAYKYCNDRELRIIIGVMLGAEEANEVA